MNIGQANDIFALLRWLLPRLDENEQKRLGSTLPVYERVPEVRAREAAMRLADAAHKAVWAGPSSADVKAAWPTGQIEVDERRKAAGKRR